MSSVLFLEIRCLISLHESSEDKIKPLNPASLRFLTVNEFQTFRLWFP